MNPEWALQTRLRFKPDLGVASPAGERSRCTREWRRSSVRRQCSSPRRWSTTASTDAARQALRGFLDKIIIPPGDGLLQVVGNFGEMLTAASGWNGSTLAAVGYVGCGGTQPAEFGVLLGSGVVKSPSFVWLRTSLTKRGARGGIRACEATPREEGLEAGVASVGIPLGVDGQEYEMDVARFVGLW